MTNQMNQKKDHTISGKIRLFGILLSIFIIIPVILFFLIQSPVVVNKLTLIFRDQIGFDISVGGISLSPDLKGEIRELHVAQSDDKNTVFFISHADIQGSINKSLQGEIKRAVLKEPKLSIVAKGDKKIDLSFLNKLPPVQFLDITKGEIQFLLESEGQLIKLTDISLNLQDFSPQKGGKLHIKCQIKMKSKNSANEDVIGYGEGNFHFTRIQPAPIGKGSIKLNIANMDWGSVNLQNLVLNMSLEMKAEEAIVRSLSPVTGSVKYRKEDKDIVFRDIQLMPFADYNIKTGQFNGGIKSINIDAVGVFDIALKTVIKQDYPWTASVKASSINFEKASEILKAFLPIQYNRWSFQGSGEMEAAMKGDYKNNNLSGTGKMMLQFKDGGFSSPDGDKAAQGVAGRIILDIQMPTPAKKGQFDISSEASIGEFLWDKYYKDFNGKKMVFRGSGNLYDDSFKTIDLLGILDLAEAGKYSYSASMNDSDWIFRINSEDIHLKDFFALFILDYLTQNIPALSDFYVSGASRIEMNLFGKGKEFVVRGILNIKEGHVNIPNNLLVSADLTLPFDLFYPLSSSSPALSEDKRLGNLYIKKIEAASFKIEELNLPLFLLKNNLWMPEGIDIPFSGTTLKLTHLKGENLLSSDRFFSLGVVLKDLEIGPHIEKAAGDNIPAKFHADLSEIIYKNGELNTKGKARVEIFGGSAEIENIHGRKLFSPSRVIGGNINFEEINLHELTDYIRLGKMAGIIKASLNGFEMEYGQPSRFVLDIESVKTKGIDQSVSVDAIDNISIMGSGAGMGVMLKSGLTRFFKHYKYSRIGIICILENDVFTIRGKIHEGGREYLIRKGFLSGIDVINQNPENNISFRDMKERVNRIFEKRQAS